MVRLHIITVSLFILCNYISSFKSFFLNLKYLSNVPRHFKLISFLNPSENIFQDNMGLMMPDRNAFASFYGVMIKDETSKISFESFILHDDLRILLEQESISLSSMKRCWINHSNTNENLSEDDAYNVLLKILSTSDNEDEYMYLEKEFKAISGGYNRLISFETFLNWRDIRSLVKDELVTKELVMTAWMNVVTSIDNMIDLESFLDVNQEIIHLLEIYGGSITSRTNEFKNSVSNFASKVPITARIIDVSDVDSDKETRSSFTTSYPKDIDVWDENFDPKEVLEKPFITYLKSFYESNAGEDGLSFKKFSDWKDLKEMLHDSRVDEGCLKDVWVDAMVARPNFRIHKCVDLDTFLRVNVLIDRVVNDVTGLLDGMTSEEVIAYYQTEFNKLTSGKRLLTFQQLIQWKDLTDMIDEDLVTLRQVEELWTALPKESMVKYYMSDVSLLNSGGISVETFVAFTDALNDLTSSETM